MHKPLANILALRDAMRKAFVGRDREIDGLFTALMARTHLLLLGPPGTAKSLLSSTFAHAIEQGAEDRPNGERPFFEILFTAFTIPDEVFGGIDLGALDRGEGMKRDLSGHLATSRVALLDEIFKANSGILNALLTVLNERKFDNGGKRIDCPLEIVIGCSNEYPEDSSLEALYDRFLMRFWVDYVPTRADKMRLLKCPDINITEKISLADIRAAQALCQGVHVPDRILIMLIDIAEKLGKDHGITVSDRRMRSMIKLLKARATLAQRNTVEACDLDVLADSLWHRHEDRSNILATVMEIAVSKSGECKKILSLLHEGLEALEQGHISCEAASSRVRAGRKDLKAKIMEGSNAIFDEILASDSVLEEHWRDSTAVWQAVSRIARDRSPGLASMFGGGSR